MVTVRIGSSLVSVRGPKTFQAEIGSLVSIAIKPSVCHLFHGETGDRL